MYVAHFQTKKKNVFKNQCLDFSAGGGVCTTKRISNTAYPWLDIYHCTYHCRLAESQSNPESEQEKKYTLKNQLLAGVRDALLSIVLTYLSAGFHLFGGRYF